MAENKHLSRFRSIIHQECPPLLWNITSMSSSCKIVLIVFQTAAEPGQPVQQAHASSLEGNIVIWSFWISDYKYFFLEHASKECHCVFWPKIWGSSVYFCSPIVQIKSWYASLMTCFPQGWVGLGWYANYKVWSLPSCKMQINPHLTIELYSGGRSES